MFKLARRRYLREIFSGGSGCTADGRHPDREESAGKPTNCEAKLPIGKTMTREDIIGMARKAGVYTAHTELTLMAGLERFAALVAAHEREKLVQVSPLEFVTAVLEKEHLIGKPIMWAQWPNEEKNEMENAKTKSQSTVGHESKSIQNHA